MTAPVLSAETVRALLHYDPESGHFTWKDRASGPQRWNTRFAGKRAGYPNKFGSCSYWVIRIFDWPFLAHRLAWLYMTSEWPADRIDHRDLDGLNNSYANLREATHQQNLANTRAWKNNRSGFKGVSLHAGRYRATIRVDGRQRLLGYFTTAEEAHAAYCDAALVRSGEYARSS